MGKSFLLFLLIALPLLFYSCVDEQNVVMNEEPQGRLVIGSVPSGAAIYLLGTPTGKTTPDSILNLEGGEYDITLRMQGYSDTTMKLMVYRNLTTSKQVILKSNQPGGGGIIVNSVPENASILLNGFITGLTTPDTINDLAAGTYNLTLKHEGYRDTSFQLSLTGNRLVTAMMSLIPIETETINNIILKSQPSGALISINNVSTSRFTPDTLENLPAGDHIIRLSRSGFYDTVFTVNVKNGLILEKDVILNEVKTVSKSVINLSSEPSGALIFLNGNNTGRTTPSSITELEPGNYQVMLRRGGFRDTSFAVHLPQSTVVNRNIDLPEVQQVVNQGSLEITSDPAGAEIFFGNTPTGHTTPFRFEDLNAGSIQVILKKQGYQDAIFNVNIIAGQVTVREISLQESNTPVTVEAGYSQTALGGIIFSFKFNQDVFLEEVEVKGPKKNDDYNFEYDDTFIKQGESRNIIILIKSKGKWELTFKGKNARGNQEDFDLEVRIDVK